MNEIKTLVQTSAEKLSHLVERIIHSIQNERNFSIKNINSYKKMIQIYMKALLPCNFKKIHQLCG